MARVTFTSNLERLVHCPPRVVDAATVGEALHDAFQDNIQLAGYILDDQNRLRRNVAIFIDGSMIRDRNTLSDPVSPDSEIYVMQALSGG